MKLSKKIELIICILEESMSDAKWFQRQQKEAEAEMTNLEHELEGVGVVHRSPPKDNDRRKLATKYQNERIRRRVAKDAVRVNEPLALFVESDVGAKAINRMRQVLGDVRKHETNMDNRVYSNRKVDNHSANNPQSNQQFNKLLRDWKRKNKNKH